jgi:polar amino acid transport system ATP-binding protein
LVKGVRGAAAEQQARQLLARVGLAEKFDAWPDQLSGGQQQRVAIARALAMEPAVLLCDEITSALDPELVGEVLKVVESLADEGMTLLMVTHEMGFARKVADRVLFMHAGRIHEMGPPAQLFASPQTAELRQFLSALA